MASTATLVAVGRNRLRYLLSFDGTATSITIGATGAATPDLVTDSVAGPIKAIATTLAPTAFVAQWLWLSDNLAGGVPVSSPLPSAKCEITQRTGTPATTFFANAGAAANQSNIVVGGPAAVCTAYLDVFVDGPQGA